jgi:hypothetical protein
VAPTPTPPGYWSLSGVEISRMKLRTAEAGSPGKKYLIS